MFEIFKNFTSLQLILIGVIILFVLMKTKEHYDIPVSGLTNTLRNDIKSYVFGIRSKAKFKNFIFRTNKDKCNILGKNDCDISEYCSYDNNKCNIKNDDDILNILNDKINETPSFKLSGF